MIRSGDSTESDYGYCRNSEGTYGWTWLPPSCHEEIDDCISKCISLTGCVGIFIFGLHFTPSQFCHTVFNFFVQPYIFL